MLKRLWAWLTSLFSRRKAIEKLVPLVAKIGTNAISTMETPTMYGFNSVVHTVTFCVVLVTARAAHTPATVLLG